MRAMKVCLGITLAVALVGIMSVWMGSFKGSCEIDASVPAMESYIIEPAVSEDGFHSHGKSLDLIMSYSTSEAIGTFGSTGNYAVVGRNTGTQPLTSIVIRVPDVNIVSSEVETSTIVCYSLIGTPPLVTLGASLASGHTSSSGLSLDAFSLAPDELFQCLISYTIAQRDVENEAGFVACQASIEATYVNDMYQSVMTTASGFAKVHVVPKPSVSVHLLASSPKTSGSAAGDNITYTYTLTNTGDVDIKDFVVTDLLSSSITDADCDIGPTGRLSALGGVGHCTIVYRLAQEDLDTCMVMNKAQVAARVARDSSQLVYSQSPLVPVTLTGSSLLATTSISFAGADHSAPSRRGSAINVNISVENEGGTTLTEVTSYAKVAGERMDLICTTDTANVLAPGAGTECYGTFSLTQASIAMGYATLAVDAAARDCSGVVTAGEATFYIDLLLPPSGSTFEAILTILFIALVIGVVTPKCVRIFQKIYEWFVYAADLVRRVRRQLQTLREAFAAEWNREPVVNPVEPQRTRVFTPPSSPASTYTPPKTPRLPRPAVPSSPPPQAQQKRYGYAHERACYDSFLAFGYSPSDIYWRDNFLPEAINHANGEGYLPPNQMVITTKQGSYNKAVEERVLKIADRYNIDTEADMYHCQLHLPTRSGREQLCLFLAFRSATAFRAFEHDYKTEAAREKAILEEAKIAAQDYADRHPPPPAPVVRCPQPPPAPVRIFPSQVYYDARRRTFVPKPKPKRFSKANDEKARKILEMLGEYDSPRYQ